MYSTKFYESHAGRPGMHRKIIDQFLDHINDKFALDCLSGHGGGEDHFMKWSPSDITIEIHNDYIVQFADLGQATTLSLQFLVSGKPDTLSAFIQY